MSMNWKYKPPGRATHACMYMGSDFVVFKIAPPVELGILMAAAPEMLEALQIVRMSAGWRAMAEETKALVLAAIDKATASTEAA